MQMIPQPQLDFFGDDASRLDFFTAWENAQSGASKWVIDVIIITYTYEDVYLGEITH